MFLRRTLPTALVAVIVAAAAPGAYASARPFNPGRLPPDQLQRVTDVCVGVMGLSPREQQTNVWGAQARPDLFGGENHYQGCIVSLSSTLASRQAARGDLMAEHDCGARGLPDGSARRAECVLDARGRPAPWPPVAAEPSAARARPYWLASNPEKRRREERACAALGLSPAFPAFDSCVKGLSDTIWEIDNPQD
jgi:hypothetical protein